MSRVVDTSLAVLNGLVGDHLARTRNPLAVPMALGLRPGALLSRPDALWSELAGTERHRFVVLVHGLMCDERIFQFPDGEDYGSLLARDAGYTPLYLRYNTGAAVEENGRTLASMLERFHGANPERVAELVLLGYSMGGLVARAACASGRADAGRWVGKVRRAVYVGTPHAGAPLERGGRLLTALLRRVPDPYTRLIADVGDLRSRGLRDLGDGARDGGVPDPLRSLDPQIEHLALAGRVAREGTLGEALGDALVPVSSGTARVSDGRAPVAGPPHAVLNSRVFDGRSHLDMARDRAVYEAIRDFLGARP